MRAFTLCLLLLGCQKPTALAPPAAPSATKPPPAAQGAADAGPSAWTEAQEACVDRWLLAQGLDAYGSPHGTQYMGGTPLFDEATGQHTTRQAFLAAHHPEALRACGLP
jgi:hypothetical protein